MFCIAAFIIFAILGIFSASHRKLARKAWYCVVKKITFKPCDINFSEEVKGKLLGKLIIRRPKLAKFLSKWFDLMAWIFVILSIWSLLTVFNSGVNLWVYGTCNASTGESCSLSGEACGVNRNDITFIEAVKKNKIQDWVLAPFRNFAETVTRIPDRLRTWNAEEYLSSTATFYTVLDLQKEYAIEILDPGCIYCKKLFENIKTANLEQKYNFSYILYPIPDSKSVNGYKFKNSYLIASYIEAVKILPLSNNKFSLSADWQIIEKIFIEQDTDNVQWQTKFNMIFGPDEAEMVLKQFLAEMGYSSEQIDQIVVLAHETQVQDSLAKQKYLVEEQVKTIRIPTLIFNGRRYDS